MKLLDSFQNHQPPFLGASSTCRQPNFFSTLPIIFLSYLFYFDMIVLESSENSMLSRTHTHRLPINIYKSLETPRGQVVVVLYGGAPPLQGPIQKKQRVLFHLSTHTPIRATLSEIAICMHLIKRIVHKHNKRTNHLHIFNSNRTPKIERKTQMDVQSAWHRTFLGFKFQSPFFDKQ